MYSIVLQRDLLRSILVPSTRKQLAISSTVHVQVITYCRPSLRHVNRENFWFPVPLIRTVLFSQMRLLNTVTEASRHHRSLLPLSILPEEEEQLLPMFLRSTSLSSPIGFLRPQVAEEILKDHQESGKQSIWNVLRRPDNSPWAICFADHVTDSETRTNAMPECPDSTSSLAFGIERAALPLFGFANFGCLLTAFYECPSTNKTMFWIPHGPGRYDCTVGGGMGPRGDPQLKPSSANAQKKLLFHPEFVEKHARCTGMLNYLNRSPYLTDGSIKPRTNAKDGEVDAFQLMDVEEFKPSSAMALVDFCIRRGIITPESDPWYLDVCVALRKPVVLPLP
ncbi:hypothetical protein F5887DRAFT_988569 [Amanita rubescens]|nr:hypothetical protein F5887DRAFT_988569 [Amanita rubescens]